jgi:LysR family glycine cleavage system transcriptional activator
VAPPLPLNALRAFEAAARHANIARAAEELSVTPGALSHQIRALESRLGVPLFERQARGVALTAEGRLLMPGLTAGFAQLRGAVDTLHAAVPRNRLVIATPPAFTSKWLVPRLHRFTQVHAEVELRIAASAAYADLAAEDVDLAVRNLALDRPGDSGLLHERLVDDVLIVVGSPALAARAGRGGKALAALPLIHDDQLAGRPGVPTWADWCQAAGWPPVHDGRRGLRFSSAEHAIEAALQGAGLLLAHALLVHDDLAAGRLVAPLDLRLPTGRAYFLVQPRRRRESPVAVAWRDWLREEMATMGAAATPEPEPEPEPAAAKARHRAVANSAGPGPRAGATQLTK